MMEVLFIIFGIFFLLLKALEIGVLIYIMIRFEFKKLLVGEEDEDYNK